MKISDAQTRISFLSGVGTVDYTNANRLVNMNRQKHKIAMMILRASDEIKFDDPNYTDVPIQLINLVASTQNYSLASYGLLEIDRVEITYDGTNWYKAEAYSKDQDIITSDATSVNSNFSTTAPFYEVKYNNIYLYPIPSSNVSSGLKIFYKREIKEIPSLDDYTTGTVTTAASTAVVGSGTTWTSSMVGRYFESTTGQAGTRYKIASVTDATHLVLETAYTGTAAAGQSYKITSDDIEFGFDEPFDDMVCVGTALDWAIVKRKNLAPDLASLYKDYANELAIHYGGKNKDRKIQLMPAYIDYK